MRALYLFINGLASSSSERRSAGGVAWVEEGDAGLTPIRPGAFARWMTARDASAGPGQGIAGRPERGRRRAASPRA